MIAAILHGARWLDEAAGRRLGPAYHAVLGIGLVAEIVRRVHELGDLQRSGVGAILAVALFGLLLLHQLGELAEHWDKRRKRTGS
jgi:hypothetical protein